MSDQQNVELVLEVEKFPCLYDSSLSSYSRKTDTDKAWAEIGKRLNLSDAECKRRWRNLRVVFTRHLKASPIGASGRKRKRYYLLDVMQFLLPFVRQAKPRSEREQAECQMSMSESGDPDTDFEVNEDDDDASDCGCGSVNNFETTQQGDDRESSETESPMVIAEHTKKKKSTQNESDQHFVDCANQDSMSNDAVTSFLSSLAPELREMNLVQFKTFKRKVLTLIDDIMDISATNFYAQHYEETKPFNVSIEKEEPQ